MRLVQKFELKCPLMGLANQLFIGEVFRLKLLGETRRGGGRNLDDKVDIMGKSCDTIVHAGERAGEHVGKLQLVQPPGHVEEDVTLGHCCIRWAA